MLEPRADPEEKVIVVLPPLPNKSELEGNEGSVHCQEGPSVTDKKGRRSASI